jgi:hypothetical protein
MGHRYVDTPKSDCDLVRLLISCAHHPLIMRSLGMEHDGPGDANECEPDTHLMSASLGAGKCSFSRCSARYVRQFLRSSQAACLFERQPTNGSSNRTADPIVTNDLLSTWSERTKLPGQLYDLQQQCSLRFGRLALPSPSKLRTRSIAFDCTL